MLFIIISVGVTLLTALINILCHAFNEPWWYLLLMSVGSAVLVVVLDGALASFIRHLPESWFHYEKKIFQVSKKEISFYRFFGVQVWKDKVPELGGFTSFHKDKVRDPKSVEYIERYLLEIDYGWMIHILSVPFGFLIILLDYKLFMGNGITTGLTIGLPIAITNAILNLMPAFILRYNYPRLRALLKFAKRSEKK